MSIDNRSGGTGIIVIGEPELAAMAASGTITSTGVAAAVTRSSGR